MGQLVYGKFKLERNALTKGLARCIRLAGILAVLLLAACSKEYKIGEEGPAGGIVFYDRGESGSDGWRYLEGMPGSIGKAEWGLYGKTIGTTGTGIGDGKKNTELIVEACKKAGETGTAAQLCDAFSLNGYEDWFLPSTDELDLVYKTLKIKGLVGFISDYAWSSSENTGVSARYQNFVNGDRDGGLYKFDEHFVHPVRAF
ncbi:MAG: DUF1566 domain-containing protein [Spirochaetales bacterium]|jgi:hypothetical protein|nr:DUF1566 domain-containing protein [Spirochaetales bacterium]